jgi:glycosyltransferase involved in cell wall biosynthesis
LAEEARARGLIPKSLQPVDLKLDWFALGLCRNVRIFAPDIVLCMGRVANAFGGHLQQRFPKVAVIGTARTGKVLPASNVRSFRRVRGIIVNTQWWQRELMETGIAGEKVRVIYNSCVLGDAHHCLDREDFRASYGACSNTCVFLNVASLRKGKRHEVLIRAVASLESDSPWALWIVGAGPELKACEKLAISLGVSDRVHFIGYQENVTPFYEAADVAVSASIEDSLPNFLVEAQSCALPVVACDYRGVRESFLPGKSGYLVNDSTAPSLGNVLKMLLEDPQRRKDLGAAGKVWASHVFSPRMQGQAHLDFFDSVFASQ